FGVVMYQMACGRLPFAGASSFETLEQIRSREPEPLSRLNPRLPAELERSIGKCLAKQRDRRYQTARELWRDLRELAQYRTIGREARASAPRLRRWAWIGVMAGAVGAGVLASALATRAHPASPGASQPAEPALALAPVHPS